MLTSSWGRSIRGLGGTAATKADVLDGGADGMDEAATEITSELIDLSGLTLAALDSYGEEALAPAIAPLLRQIDNPTNSIGGHNS
jgi:hypothetical protein